MKRTVNALILMLSVCFVCVCFTQADAQPVKDTTFKVSPNDITNQAAIERMDHERAKRHAAKAIDSWQRMIAAEQEVEEESYDYEEPVYDYGYDYYDYEPVSYDYAPSYYPTDGLTPTGGVNYYDGRTETYYSSALLYHPDTPEWTLDDEGFYRDDDGRYVVAASDMERGTVFEGSKGECIVLDCGCANGVTDYYVAW